MTVPLQKPSPSRNAGAGEGFFAQTERDRRQTHTEKQTVQIAVCFFVKIYRDALSVQEPAETFRTVVIFTGENR